MLTRAKTRMKVNSFQDRENWPSNDHELSKQNSNSLINMFQDLLKSSQILHSGLNRHLPHLVITWIARFLAIKKFSLILIADRKIHHSVKFFLGYFAPG